MKIFCFTLNHVAGIDVVKHYDHTRCMLDSNTDYHVWYNNSSYNISGHSFHQRCVDPDYTVRFMFEVMALYPDYDYYMFVEGDCALLRKGLDTDSVEYMIKNRIGCLFPALTLTGYKDPMKKMFEKQYKYDFKYSILSHFVISKEALKVLCQYWWNHWTSHCEINMPGVLESHGCKIAQSPFVDSKYFRCQRPNDLSEEEIKTAYTNGSYAIHPIRDIGKIKQYI